MGLPLLRPTRIEGGKIVHMERDTGRVLTHLS